MTTQTTQTTGEAKEHRVDRRLRDLVDRAIQVGRYMIIVSIWDEGTIFHDKAIKSFPTADLLPSLRHHLEKMERQVIHGIK